MTNMNKWAIPKNIERPVETVYELKGNEYKVPSFEEFMKDYQADENLNYDDLSGGSVGEVKGYGPCISCVGKSGVRSNGSTGFKLEIELVNFGGGAIRQTVYNVEQAWKAVGDIRNSRGYWEGNWNTGFFSNSNREYLANTIVSAICLHEQTGRSFDSVVSNKKWDDEGCLIM